MTTVIYAEGDSAYFPQRDAIARHLREQGHMVMRCANMDDVKKHLDGAQDVALLIGDSDPERTLDNLFHESQRRMNIDVPTVLLMRDPDLSVIDMVADDRKDVYRYPEAWLTKEKATPERVAEKIEYALRAHAERRAKGAPDEAAAGDGRPVPSVNGYAEIVPVRGVGRTQGAPPPKARV